MISSPRPDPDAERRALLEALRDKTQARENLAAYIAYMGLGIEPQRHHRFVLGELEALEAGRTRRLIILQPPGSAKSTYCSQIFPAWFLGRNPRSAVIATSHTEELSDRFGRRVRNLVAQPEHQAVFGDDAAMTALAEDSRAVGQWETKAGGEYFAVGVGGALAGRRADLAIIDDPYRNWEDAQSRTRRQAVWDWYKADFFPRLKPGARQMIVCTPWHDDDLMAQVVRQEPEAWRVVRLPLEAEADDPIGRAPGERLWPEWYTDDMVETAKLEPRIWNAAYQLRPVPEGGEYFVLEWFGTTELLPERLTTYGASDYAATEGAGDWTEHGVFSVDTQDNIYIRDWWRGQKTTDVWIERQCDLIGQYEPMCWFGEAGPIKRAIEPYLVKRMDQRHTHCRLEWLPSIANKGVRLRAFQALASRGKVFLPANAMWKAELLGQLTRFPAGHDDGVDVCSLLGRGLEIVKAPAVRRKALRVVAGSGTAGGWMSI